MASKNPKTVTIYGRLSYPVFSHAEAVVRNQKSDYPQKPEDVTAEFNLLLEQEQLDKLVNHVENVFLPWCVENKKNGEQRNALDEKQVAKILEVVHSDWESQPPYIAIKPVPEKTQPLAPEAVASVKVKGPRQADITLKAIVNSEDDLVVPDPAITSFPVLKPLNQTVHTMYGGAYVAATLNLYSFLSGKLPGFSASASVAIFKADGDRFGGGTEVDEDEIFAD